MLRRMQICSHSPEVCTLLLLLGLAGDSAGKPYSPQILRILESAARTLQGEKQRALQPGLAAEPSLRSLLEHGGFRGDLVSGGSNWESRLPTLPWRHGVGWGALGGLCGVNEINCCCC